VRRIFPLSTTCSVLVVISFACSGGQSPVDTSQTILAETGASLALIDRTVALGVRSSTDAAVVRAAERVNTGECVQAEEREECVVRFLREEMDLWYQLTAALEAAHGTLEAWELANDGWRTSGERPADWSERVCEPFGAMVTTILELLERVDVDVPETWRALLGRSDMLCSLGVSIGGGQ